MDSYKNLVLERQEKKRIAARARTLQDRLATPYEQTDTYVAGTTEDWLEEWRQRVSEDDFGAFLERLDVSDLSIEACRQSVSVHRWPEEAPLPEWTDRIDELLDSVTTSDCELSFESEEADEVPFFHILREVVEYASEQVAWTASDRLASGSRAAFEGWLQERLESLLAHPLFIEFKTFVAVRDRELATADDPELPSSPRRYYTSFVEDLLEGDGFKSFFLEYSVLAKHIATTIEQWVEAVETFRSRVVADLDAIRETFNAGKRLGAITDIDFLGDRHQHGQLVFAITFESGTKVAYKPRNVEPEATFNEFLSWVNRATDLSDLRTLDCLVRDEYGWIEWVESEPCASRDEVASYYRRAGMHLCFLYALNFTDGHLENVIAVEDQPVLIDLETLCQPDLPMEKQPKNVPLRQLIRDSALRTFLLPVNTSESDMKNINGFGKGEGKQTNAQIPEFERVNTDVMELTYRSEVTIGGESLPRVGDETVEPTEHYDAIADGFEQAYRSLLENRDELLRDGGPVDNFDRIACRFIYRATVAYQSRLVHFTTPSHLRVGLTFGCRVEELVEPFATGSTDWEMWPVYEAERAAMWRLDVPRFTVRTDSTDLFHDGKPVLEDAFDVCPFEQVSNRIKSLSEDDLQEQLDYITLAYTSKKAFSPSSVDHTPRTDESASVETLATEMAHDLFDQIQTSAHRASDDEFIWYLRENYTANGFNFQLMDGDLYNGRVGIGLFSAALAASTGDNVYREFTKYLLTPIADELDAEDPLAEMQIGGGHGIASLVYGFTKIGEILDSDWATQTAGEFASLLTPERLESDSMLDVLNGNAGVVLSLLALYDRTGNQEVLDTAVRAGDYLLSNRVERDGSRVWLTIRDNVLTGFAHGVAGIAYALFELADETGETRFRNAALESLRFERESFSTARGNWPVLDPELDDDYSLGWSAGSAGIGLARLGMYETEARDAFETEIRHALQNDDPDVLLDNDYVAHGNFGRVEFLLRAGQTLNEDYTKRARAIAAATIRRADERGRFATLGGTDHWCNPSFFHGDSGIGYSLLRLANPELPCILLWE